MVEILDSTLREGEQTPYVTFSVEEKLTIAQLLDEFGIDIIEAGHPIVSEDICQSVKIIANQGFKADILAHCRAIRDDINIALKCDVNWVGIFFCVSNKRLEEQFRTNIHRAIDIISDTIEYAKDHGLNVRYTPEDAVRTEYKSLLNVSQAAIEAGVDRISIADTVGAMNPTNMYNLIKRLKSDLNIEFNIHCHNDLGLATANALAAYEAGVKMIDVSINGLGERTGITSLAEVCLALNCIYKINNNWKFTILPEISQIVSKFSKMNLSPNTPIVGDNAFLHNAGLHVSAVLNNPYHYEVFPAELIGRKRDFILDKMTGINTIKLKLKKMGIEDSYENASRILSYAKSKEKGNISDYEILEILNPSELSRSIFQ